MTTTITPLTNAAIYNQANAAGTQAEALVDSFFIGVKTTTLPTAGRIFGLGLSLSEPSTAGQLLVRPSLDGVPVGAQQAVPIGETNVFFRTIGQTFVAGAALGFLLETVGLLPAATIEFIGNIYVVLNPGISTDENL